jgi:hypothetical protein
VLWRGGPTQAGRRNLTELRNVTELRYRNRGAGD